MASYLLSPEAARSIAEIDTYTAKQFGPKQAIRYLESVLDRLEFIAEDPQRGMHRPELNVDCFSYFIGSHTIYYRVTTGQIQVIDVLHQSMEPARHPTNTKRTNVDE
ncbi:MAG: toxin ParE1/3/4 [Gammaproteobacteria bacterium]